MTKSMSSLAAPSRLLIGALLVILTGAGLAPSAYAQGATDALFFAQRSPATGPRLTAMGGASIAGVGDYGSFYSNPAGLGLLESSQFAGSFRSLLTTDEASYTTFRADESAFGTSTTDRTRTGYGIGNVALAYKVPTEQGSLVIGAALNETRHFGRDLDFSNRNALSSVSDFFLPLNDEVDVQEFAPGEGPDDLFFGQELITTDDADFLVDFDPDGNGQINRPLSFIAFQTFGIDLVPAFVDPDAGDAQAFLPVVTPGTEFRQVGDVSEEGNLRELNFGGSVAVAPGVLVGGSANVTVGTYDLRDTFEEVDDLNENDGTDGTVDFQSLRLTRTLESDLTGFGLRFGLSAEVAPSVRAGLTIETPTWYSIDETSSIRLQTNFDNGDRFLYGDDADEDVGRTAFDYDVRTPWRLGGGLSVQIDDLRLLADAVFVDWTRLQLDDNTGGNLFEVENDLIEDVFDPVVNTRLGFEYRLDALALRGGFAYQPSPVSLSEIDAESFGGSLNLRGTDEVNDRPRTYFSAGLGYQLSEQLHVDVSWMQQRFDDRTLPYTSTNASFVNEEVARNQILVGVRYHF
jgi:long-subunit fatty acid transport protein